MSETEQPHAEENKMPKWLVLLWIAALIGLFTYIAVQLNQPQ